MCDSIVYAVVCIVTVCTYSCVTVQAYNIVHVVMCVVFMRQCIL